MVAHKLPKYDKFISNLEKMNFEYLGQGSFRMVYKRGKIVIKIPLSVAGLLDNMAEHRAYHTYFSKRTKQGFKLAPCRLLPNGTLMMVAMRFTWDAKLPRWATMIDGHQVGQYKGKTVAYDYALNLVERLEWEEEWLRENPKLAKGNFFLHSDNWEYTRARLMKTKKRLESKRAAS